MSRTTERQGFDDKARLTLLEGDMDRLVTDYEKLEASVTSGFKKQDARLNAILVTLATSAVLFAANIVASFAQGG